MKFLNYLKKCGEIMQIYYYLCLTYASEVYINIQVNF